MDQLLALYEEILKAATDDQILPHLTNMAQDVVALSDTVKSIIDQAKQRAATTKPA